MLTASAVLFGIAALGGIVLAFKGERSTSMAVIHGLVAAAALILLILSVIQGATGTLPVTALVLFVIAALGGFVLFSHHLRSRQLPKALIFLHGILAVIAEVLLIIDIL
jgi:hypothetical protein